MAAVASFLVASQPEPLSHDDHLGTVAYMVCVGGGIAAPVGFP